MLRFMKIICFSVIFSYLLAEKTEAAEEKKGALIEKKWVCLRLERRFIVNYALVVFLLRKKRNYRNYLGRNGGRNRLSMPEFGK